MGGGAQGLEQSGAALPVRKQGQGWELEQPEHEQVPTWDASAASRGFTYYTMAPAPGMEFFRENVPVVGRAALSARLAVSVGMPSCPLPTEPHHCCCVGGMCPELPPLQHPDTVRSLELPDDPCTWCSTPSVLHWQPWQVRSSYPHFTMEALLPRAASGHSCGFLGPSPASLSEQTGACQAAPLGSS